MGKGFPATKNMDCYSLAVIFFSFIFHLIGHETINIPEIFSGVHCFTRKTVMSRAMHMAVHVHYNAWYISLPSSVKQDCEMIKLYVLWRT